MSEDKTPPKDKAVWEEQQLNDAEKTGLKNKVGEELDNYDERREELLKKKGTSKGDGSDGLSNGQFSSKVLSSRASNKPGPRTI